MTNPSCRLYLVAPVADNLDAMIEALTTAAAASDIAALLLPLALAQKPQAKSLIAAAQANGIAAIIETDAELARDLRADGVEVAGEPALYTAARRVMGANAIVGAACASSRHTAMTMGEAGADYVALHSDIALIDWWSSLFEVPCVAASPVALENAPALIAARPDFLRPSMDIWTTPTVAADYARAIAEHAP